MTDLLHIGSGSTEILEHLRDSGVSVRSADGPVEPGTSADVVLITPEVSAPVEVARRLHGAVPEAHIVFVTTPESDPIVRRELLVARIGRHWSIAPADEPASAATVVRQAIAGMERRRRLRTSLSRMNVQLAESSSPVRRALISDQFLASVLDQLSDAVVVLDPEGRTLAWNQAATRAFGQMRQSALFGDALPAAAQKAVDRALGSELGHAESVMTTSDVDYGLRATALRDVEGRVVGMAVVARDITREREEERRRVLIAESIRLLASSLDIRESLQKLTNLLVADFADVALADVVDGEVVTRYAASGRSAREQKIVERTADLVLSAARHPSVEAIAQGAARMRNGIGDEFLRQMAVSAEHLALLRELQPRAMIVAPLLGQQISGAILVVRTSDDPFSQADADLVTEIAREAASALHNAWAYRTAAEASRLKDEFLATVSHELRTPMTSILGWSQILRLGQTTPEIVQDGLESIERSARAQSQLIDDLLDLSRMQMGKLQLATHPFSLAAVVRAALDTVRPAAQARSVSLTLDSPEDISILGDPDRMQQVAWNLLSNAVKFSNPGGEVTIAIAAEENVARITVTDAGEGIPPEFLPHVFDRFRQAEPSTTRRFGGLGLGLTIVKQLVELHGGSVEAASRGAGQGATFTVTLPRAPAEGGPPADPGSPAPLADLHGIRVLVVEEDPASVATLRVILEKGGADVRVVSSATAALNALRAEIPDVLVSDVATPEEEGISLIRAIRSTLRISEDRLPALALTAFADVGLRVRLLGSGFQRFMTKPPDARQLSVTVASLAGRQP